MTNQRASDAARRTAGPTSKARAAANRKNGAKSRGPKSEEGKARSARNALRHGLRSQKYVVLPHEDGAEFAALEAALIEELAPVGALQAVLARRVAVATWRLARADRLEVEVLEVRGYADASPGLALIRDGNGTRSIETLLRYRGAAMAELTRSLRTLKALQAEQAAAVEQVAATRVLEAHRQSPAAPAPLSRRPKPNKPERPSEYLLPEQPGRTLHESPAPRQPDEPEPGRTLHEAGAPWQPDQPAPSSTPNEPDAGRVAADERGGERRTDSRQGAEPRPPMG
jgi:hypothetical protein